MTESPAIRVLVMNTGSSSVKYQLIELPSEEVIDSGQRDRVGVAGGGFDTHREAVQDILGSLPEHLPPDVVGHRVVHGGTRFSSPEMVSDSVLEELEPLNALAPLHNPPSIAGIRAASEVLPEIPQVAVFDTAFFAELPAVATDYTLPREIQDRFGIRKYGFHGSSHEYVAHQVQDLVPGADRDTRVIIFHLGNGSSVTALRGTTPVDTSMGFTPLPGLVMGTRSGDIDPSIALHLMHDGDFSSEDISSMLTMESGLVGMSGVSDMRDLFDRAESGDDAASHAIDVWVWRARHYLGAYIAHLGGLDVVVFTGGIGENQATLRERITEDTDFIGLHIDHNENVKASNSPRPISSADSDVAVWVIPTNEELHIARLAARAL